MPERSKKILTVDFPKPGFGITDTHDVIRTQGLSTCIAVGGTSNRPGLPALFMTHFPDFCHNRQVEILTTMGLQESNGDMFIFAKDPEQLGLYFVSIDGGPSTNYASAVTALSITLADKFPNFKITTHLYGDRRFGQFPSFAEIDLDAGYIKTDRETKLICSLV